MTNNKHSITFTKMFYEISYLKKFASTGNLIPILSHTGKCANQYATESPTLICTHNFNLTAQQETIRAPCLHGLTRGG